MKSERSFKGIAVSPVALVLMAGRERVARGWCQAWLRLDGHLVCAVGALLGDDEDVISLMRPEALSARELLNDAVGGSITRYNDSFTTTKDDVIAAYDRAIGKALMELGA